VEVSADPWRWIKDQEFLTVKPRNDYSASLFRDAVRADLHHSRYEGRHSRYEARHVARKPSKWKWVAAAAAAAGGIAAVATAAPWSGGSASLTADQRVTTTRHSSAFSSALTNMAKSAAADTVNSRADVAGKSQGAASGSKAAAPASKKPARPAAAPAHSAAKPSAAKPSAPAAAKPAVVNPGTVHAAQKKAAPAHSATPKQSGGQSGQASQSTQSTQATPTTFYDSVEPGYIPTGAAVATYADGPYAQSAASLAGRGTIMWIDVSGGDPNADALDIEPTDATPAVAAAWVDTKLTQDPSSYPILYTSYSEWSEVKADVAQLPSWMASHVKYWIADPTGYAHILPGASATQWYWGATYDISSAVPGFFP
jgi:hypothetical protein